METIMKPFSKTFNLGENLKVTITRLQGTADCSKKYKYLAIKQDAFYRVSICSVPCFLAKLYAALELLTGPMDYAYDDWKGSYSFCFKLMVEKNQNISEYIYKILHYRSFIDFYLSQIVNKDDPRKSGILYKPNDDLFSNENICHFSQFFCEFALGYLIGSNHKPKPFVKSSESNLILFGFIDDDYFTEGYEDCEEYRNRKDQLTALVEES